MVFTGPQSLFSLPSIFDIGQEKAPADNMAFCVAHGQTSCMEPPIHAVGSPDAFVVSTVMKFG